jgi:hypothetical protein
MAHRGNPNWGKRVPVFHPLSHFEREVARLKLRPQDYEHSVELRNWCQRYARSHFVPEQLLKCWRIVLQIDDW